MRIFLLLWSIVGAIDANRPAVEESWSGSERPSRGLRATMLFPTSKKWRKFTHTTAGTSARGYRRRAEQNALTRAENCDHHRVPRSVGGRHDLGSRSYVTVSRPPRRIGGRRLIYWSLAHRRNVQRMPHPPEGSSSVCKGWIIFKSPKSISQGRSTVYYRLGKAWHDFCCVRTGLCSRFAKVGEA
jgi:hypothetical protein